MMCSDRALAPGRRRDHRHADGGRDPRAARRAAAPYSALRIDSWKTSVYLLVLNMASKNVFILSGAQFSIIIVYTKTPWFKT